MRPIEELPKILPYGHKVRHVIAPPLTPEDNDLYQFFRAGLCETLFPNTVCACGTHKIVWND